MLVGVGAWRAAQHWDLPTFDEWTPLTGSLVSPEARNRHRAHSESIERWRPSEDLVKAQDTVGSLVLDFEGNISVAASSGGISLKMPGRVGPAGVPGSGIWVERVGSPEGGSCTVACCTSGIIIICLRGQFSRLIPIRPLITAIHTHI